MPAHNLPHQSTPFVGRSGELTEIAALLADPACRLLTLFGAGGIGKTRLALQAAAIQLPRFANGVCFVPLAPVTSPDQIATALASALQISFTDPVQIMRFLRDKHILLVMDNFEHLLGGVSLLADILRAAPAVRLLVTSRERLNLQEEWTFPLGGLSVPDDASIKSLADFSAVQLFVQRARQVQPKFSLSGSAGAVTTICQRVEGMPLALELAASWLRAMTCAQVAAQVAGSIDFLTTPHRNVPERHRSLRAVFEQSWNLLSPAEQQVMARLTVFRGGFDIEAAEQVAGASLALLAALVDKSLIRLNAGGRYDLHELLRQYAAEMLSADELASVMRRHFAFFLRLAQQTEAHQFGREQVPWFDRMEVEMNNVRVALAHSLQTQAAGAGIQLATALGWFFSERTYWNEGVAWFDKLFAANPVIQPSLRAKALYMRGAIGWFYGDPQAFSFLRQALSQARATNDRWTTAWVLNHLWNDSMSVDECQSALDESLALFRQLNDPMGIAHTLVRRAWFANSPLKDYAAARILLAEASVIARDHGDKTISAWVAYTLGQISWLLDRDLIQARNYLETSLSLFREARFQVATVLSTLANVELALGNLPRAQTLYVEALTHQGRVMPNYCTPITGLACIAARSGQFERAAIIIGHVVGEVGTSDLGETYFPEIFSYQADISIVRVQLGEINFAEALAVGQAMSEEQIVPYALAAEAARAAPLPAHSQPLLEPLTPRELSILQLLAAGHSNRAIAEQLVLTPGTVKWYVSQILGKLNVSNRTQAVAQAQQLHLLAPIE